MSIYSKLGAIQSELKAPKNQFNNFGGYSYRSCEDILEAVKPLLKKYKAALTIEDSIETHNNRVYIKATARLFDADAKEGEGSEIVTTAYAREPDEKKGMDPSQISGMASSYARKYCLNGLFCIDDNKDADTNEVNLMAEKADIKAAKAATKKQAPRPLPEETKYLCKDCGKEIEAGGGMTSAVVAKARADKYGRALCQACARKATAAEALQNVATPPPFEDPAPDVELPFEIN